MKLLHNTTCLLLLALLFSTPAFAQSGKVNGTVTDAGTGNPLPGVNVVVEGQQIGATTNAEGFYAILNVSPGTYTIRASFVGYADKVIENVDVNANLTTQLDIQLEEQTVGLEEVTIQAQEPIVKPDISANVSNLSSENIENLPVSSVTEVVEMQAGVESGLRVRGSEAANASFLVDGMSTRNPRDNTPFTGLSYTSIKRVQVQTGGFNAEYGNVRSGLVNVTTREGPRDHYVVDALVRYSAPKKEYFGVSPGDPMEYYMRPYLDPEVAFVGTHSEESSWDQYTQRQYPTFEGWNAISESLLEDEDPNNDLTPEQAREVYQWHHRKDFGIDDPDYTIDGSIGGPVPGVSNLLGDLRFFASYRQVQNPYLIPQRRESYQERTAQLKLTSDLARGMKLTVQGLYAKQLGLEGDWSTLMKGDGSMKYRAQAGTGTGSGVFAKDVFPLGDISRLNLGAKFTHTLGASTFYELRFQRNAVDYFMRPGPTRSSEIVNTIGGMELTEAPFGFDLAPSFGLAGGMWFGGRYATHRDTSDVAVWSGDFDITSQVHPTTQVKAGVEYHFTDYNANHGIVMPSFASAARPKYRYHRQPAQGAAYVQNKLEFEGMVANMGLRLDYMDGGEWWYDHKTYDRALATADLDSLSREDIDPQFSLSPRLGISFPTSEKSKLYFNYGHFRRIQNPTTLFDVAEKETGGISRIGNPGHPMPKTVAYELGYEHSLFDQYLLRLTGYYKALDDQPRSVSYTSLTGLTQYSMLRPYNYEDIRGLELTVRKNTGRWIRGFANLTYMVRKEGNFGFASSFENRQVQRRYERETVEDRSRPVPEPFSRFNIEFLTPADFGPALGDIYPIGNWRMSWLGAWRAGEVSTWAGGSEQPGLVNNVRWADYYNLDLRLMKSFGNLQFGEVQVFADISNVLNIRHFNRYGSFLGKRDFQEYMWSLHLPEDTFEELEGDPYKFVPGDDKPGDFRKPGVEFVPIEVVSTVDDVASPHPRPLYYEEASDEYKVYKGGSWREADSGRVEQVLEDKAYVDMPNVRAFRFLNPRRITFGIRVTL